MARVFEGATTVRAEEIELSVPDGRLTFPRTRRIPGNGGDHTVGLCRSCLMERPSQLALTPARANRRPLIKVTDDQQGGVIRHGPRKPSPKRGYIPANPGARVPGRPPIPTVAPLVAAPAAADDIGSRAAPGDGHRGHDDRLLFQCRRPGALFDTRLLQPVKARGGLGRDRKPE